MQLTSGTSSIPDDGDALMQEPRRRGISGQRVRLFVVGRGGGAGHAQRRQSLVGALRERLSDGAMTRLEVALEDNRRERLETLEQA